MNNNRCLICFDAIQNPSILTCCQKSSCAECIASWFKTHTECPDCLYVLPMVPMVPLQTYKPCVICLEPIQTPSIPTTCCQKSSCAECIASWFKTHTKCPDCLYGLPNAPLQLHIHHLPLPTRNVKQQQIGRAQRRGPPRVLQFEEPMSNLEDHD